MAQNTWDTYIAGGSLPAVVQQLCEALDTHDRDLPGPLGGAISNAFIEAINTLAGG